MIESRILVKRPFWGEIVNLENDAFHGRKIKYEKMAKVLVKRRKKYQKMAKVLVKWRKIQENCKKSQNRIMAFYDFVMFL